MIPRVNSFTNWSSLKEVWLGDCYPAHFYDHLESEVRDVFYEITQKTQEDLAVIQRKLVEFGVVVRRPHYERIDQYLWQEPSRRGQLRKPFICPRDHFLVHGNTLYGYSVDYEPWTEAVAEYRQDPAVTIMDRENIAGASYINGANTVRAGRDIYLDSHYDGGQHTTESQEYQQLIRGMFQDYRIHQLHNGGHVDGCFAAVKPGVLLTSAHFSDYERTFPGWECINVSRPEFQRHRKIYHRLQPPANGKWWLPGIQESAKFNEHIIAHARDWVGDYTETYFEVNCLVIDQHNVLVLGENEGVFRRLEQHGITAHSLPFRTRTFWDGGLHCLTLDIRRDDSMVDLFPERTENFYTY